MDRLLRDRRAQAPTRQLSRLQRRDGRAVRQSRHHTGAVVQHAYQRGVEEYRKWGQGWEKEEGEGKEL